MNRLPLVGLPASIEKLRGYVRERSPDGSFNHTHSIARDPANDYGAKPKLNSVFDKKIVYQ